LARVRRPAAAPGTTTCRRVAAAELAHDGDRVFETADVDGVELGRILAPDLDQRGAVADRIATARGGQQRGAIADVAVDRLARQLRLRRASCEHHGRVPARRQRANDCLAKIAGAAGDQHAHGQRLPRANLPGMFKRQTTGSVVCASCGYLVGVRDETCYHCGRRNPGLWGFAPALRSLGNDSVSCRS
jgi:hypothetical protein